MLLGVQHLLIYVWMHLLLLIHCTISRTYHQLTSDKILRVRMKENRLVHTLRSRESVLPVVSKYCNSSSCGRSLRHGSQNNYFPSIFVTFTSLSFISPKRGGRGWTDICLLRVSTPSCVSDLFFQGFIIRYGDPATYLFSCRMSSDPYNKEGFCVIFS